jgi:hypothetical protein
MLKGASNNKNHQIDTALEVAGLYELFGPNWAGNEALIGNLFPWGSMLGNQVQVEKDAVYNDYDRS